MLCVGTRREGARVCITARSQEHLDAVIDEINSASGDGHAVAVDLTILESCQKVVSETVARFGGVDILVNCAGAARGGDILDLPTKLIDDALSLKSYSYLRLSQLVIPHMRQNGWGRIINIAGGAGTSPSSGNIPVSLANIAILNMTRALSDAVSKDGILVNTICPGLTNTQRARDVQQASADEAGKDVEELLKSSVTNSPQGVSLNRRKLPMWWHFWHQSRARIYSAVLYTWTAAGGGGHRRRIGHNINLA